MPSWGGNVIAHGVQAPSQLCRLPLEFAFFVSLSFAIFRDGETTANAMVVPLTGFSDKLVFRQLGPWLSRAEPPKGAASTPDNTAFCTKTVQAYLPPIPGHRDSMLILELQQYSSAVLEKISWLTLCALSLLNISTHAKTTNRASTSRASCTRTSSSTFGILEGRSPSGLTGVITSTRPMLLFTLSIARTGGAWKR